MTQPGTPDFVTDEQGRVLELGDPLGRGGQGTVYRVRREPELAVKILTQAPSRPLETVRRLPLNGINIAAPTLLLQDVHGYVMRLAADMVPLRTLIPVEFVGKHHTLAWYAETGGLQRRLELAARLASTLARLHGLALVYTDLNPNNVLVSDSQPHREVWLIDADNLTTTSVAGINIGFARFWAPERYLRRSGPTTLTDAYAFAVTTFALLAMVYPFEGVLAEQMSGEEAIDRTDRGELPYGDDPNDDRNRLTTGIPRAYALSPVLSELALRTFGEGRLDATRRPSVAMWRDALWRAAYNVVVCPKDNCRWTYYRHLKSCPMCGTPRPKLLGVTVRRSSEGEPGAPLARICVQPDMSTVVQGHWVWPGHEFGRPVALVRHSEGQLTVHTPREAHEISLAVVHPRKGQAKATRLEVKFGRTAWARVKLEATEQPSRFLDFTWLES